MKKGKIFITGIGPGSPGNLSILAKQVILEADIIIGYKTYLSLIEYLLKNKKVIHSGMRDEVKRCMRAIEEAELGNTVVLVSGGDPGLYGMSGLIYELSEKKKTNIDIEVIPGISAIFAAAACLGAPVMHDCAIISLSNLLTPWNIIRHRLECAGHGDFVIILYNPASKSRKEQIKHAQNILLEYKNPETPAGIVWNATRKNENSVITNLRDFTKYDINMQSIVLIGNSTTYIYQNKIITPRGYNV